MRWVWIVVGVVAVLLGVVWTLQGLDLLGADGGMNGNKLWAVVGPIVAILGLVALTMGGRRRSGS